MSFLLISTLLLYFSIFIYGVLLTVKKAKAARSLKKLSVSEPVFEIPDSIPCYKELSFSKDKLLESAYGASIILNGIGVTGASINCYTRSKDTLLEGHVWAGTKSYPAMNWQIGWKTFAVCFPQYEHEILMLTNEGYRNRYEAEELFSKHISSLSSKK